MDNKREPIIHHEDGESGQRQWVREREAELRPEPTVGDRKTAARIVEDINCELVSDKPVVLTEEWIDKIAAALAAARRDAARKAYKAGWESAMYDAHVNYGADDGAPAPELTDANVAAILEGVKA